MSSTETFLHQIIGKNLHGWYPSLLQAMRAIKTKHRYAQGSEWWPSHLLPPGATPAFTGRKTDFSEGCPVFSEGELVATLWREDVTPKGDT